MFITYPAVKQVRALYDKYHMDVWPDGLFSEEAWGDFDERKAICQMPFSQPLFFTAILLTWTGTCMVNLKDTAKYIQLWWQLETPRSSLVDLEPTEDEDAIVATGASKQIKFVVIVFVLLPKVLVAVFLWWLGARWLAATPSFVDLLLNAIALSFITDLSTLIYEVLMPEDVMKLVSIYKIKRNSSPIDHRDEEKLMTEFCHRFGKMVMSGVLVVGVPCVYFIYLQQVLPGYKWDIHEVCTSWLDELQGDMDR